MKFIQLGCSVSLVSRNYYKWPSIYYGVDISQKTIEYLNKFVSQNNLAIGGLHCTSLHQTQFADCFFDIGECIGVLEYFEKDFVLKAIKEFHRIMKPGGRFVVDIPNLNSPSGKMAMMIEQCMGRPDKFNLQPQQFEDLIKDYFEIIDSDAMRAQNAVQSHQGALYFYCLKCKK